MEHKRWVTSVVQRAILLVTLVSSASAACRQGNDWIQFQGNCYYWSNWHWEARSWFWAELNCKHWGGTLVSVQSQSEAEFLLRLTGCRSDFWIGLVNTYPQSRQHPESWQWWDGALLNYSALSPVTANYTDCVYSDSNGRWHNTYCQTYFSSVCKAPAVRGTSDELLPIAEDSPEVLEAVDEYAWNGTTVSPPPNRCPSGWYQLGSSCYYHSLNRTNYFNAQMSCEAMGASVTSVLTQREHTLLTVLLGCNMPTWIGLEKARPCFTKPNTDYCWVWMDRSPLVYSNWAPNQQLDRLDAECVILDGRWKVTNCYNEFGYLCKKSAT